MSNSHVDGFELNLNDPIYDQKGKLYFEVRDFGKGQRTLVIRTMIDGNPITTLVHWDEFTDALDTMRTRMMSEDWDQSLTQLIALGGSND